MRSGLTGPPTAAPSRKGPTPPMGLAPRTRTRLAAALLVAPLVGSPVVLLASAADAQTTGAVKALNTNQFDPATITISVGGTVTWTNEGSYHTVTGGDGAEDASSPIGRTVLADASATAKVTFDKPGTYPYFCEPHVSIGMKGEIVVKAAAGGAPAPAASAGGPTTAPDGAGASGAPRPDANPSDADPAKVDPGAAAPSESSGPGGGTGVDEDSGVPGSTAKDNPTLKEIEELRAAESGRLGGFNALLAAASAALLALCVAVFASTRPRRPTK